MRHLALQHVATGGSFTRTYGLEEIDEFTTTNRLSTLTVGSTTFDYTFDAAGQLVQENTERHHVWDAGGRLRSFRVQVYNGGMFVWDEPTVYARYLYDAAGSRVKKVTRVGSDRGSVTYVGGAKGSFEWHEELDKDGDPERTMSVTHVSDETRRIAEVQAGTPPDDDTRPPVRYHLGDHLGNSVVTIGGADATGVTVIEREEYYPYGETSYGSHGRKRWRYNGKERDGESGLYMYGARYYAPWALRFVSVDPLYSEYPQYQPYAYAGNKPVSFIDIDGRQEGSATRSNLPSWFRVQTEEEFRASVRRLGEEARGSGARRDETARAASGSRDEAYRHRAAVAVHNVGSARRQQRAEEVSRGAREARVSPGTLLSQVRTSGPTHPTPNTGGESLGPNLTYTGLAARSSGAYLGGLGTPRIPPPPRFLPLINFESPIILSRYNTYRSAENRAMMTAYDESINVVGDYAMAGRAAANLSRFGTGLGYLGAGLEAYNITTEYEHNLDRYGSEEANIRQNARIVGFMAGTASTSLTAALLPKSMTVGGMTAGPYGVLGGVLFAYFVGYTVQYVATPSAEYILRNPIPLPDQSAIPLNRRGQWQ